MSPEQLRIYNRNRTRKGLPKLQADDDTSFLVDNADVYPYTTGFIDHTTSENFTASVYHQLDEISNSTQFLFDAADSAQQAADDAKVAYDAAQDAQATANQASSDAISALEDFEAQQEQLNAQQTQINDNVAQIGQAQADATQAIVDANNAAGIATTANETAGQAITDAASAQAAAEAAQNEAISANTAAINAQASAAATSAATVQIDNSNGGVHSITVYDNKTVSREITLLPLVASGIGGSDQHTLHLIVSLNGSTLYSREIDLGGYQNGGSSGVLTYSHSFTMNPGAGNQTYQVDMGGGDLWMKNFSNMTVLATQNLSNDFGIS